MLEDFVHRFERYLHAHGKRLSRPQKMIAISVCEYGGSFSAEEISKLLRSSDPPIGRATVYRTLGLFEAAGLVAKFQRTE